MKTYNHQYQEIISSLQALWEPAYGSTVGQGLPCVLCTPAQETQPMDSPLLITDLCHCSEAECGFVIFWVLLFFFAKVRGSV